MAPQMTSWLASAAEHHSSSNNSSLLGERLLVNSDSATIQELRDYITSNCSGAGGVARIGAGAASGPTSANSTQGDRTAGGGRNLTLDEFQIVKAVVLGLVTCIILLSICKMVFQLFVRYTAKTDDR